MTTLDNEHHKPNAYSMQKALAIQDFYGYIMLMGLETLLMSVFPYRLRCVKARSIYDDRSGEVYVEQLVDDAWHRVGGKHLSRAAAFTDIERRMGWAGQEGFDP